MKLLSNHYLNTIYLWIVLITSTFTFTNIYTLTLVIAYTGYLPHINAVLWLSISETGKKIKEKLEIWHWAIFISYIVIAYSIYAQSWSASLLNEAFPIDPAKFGITNSIVTLLVAPISLLYHQDFIGSVHTVAILASMFIAPILVLAFLVGFSLKSIFKWIGKFFATILLVSFFVTIMFNFNEQLKNVVIKLALNTDFNKYHPCSNDWVRNAESLIFLGGDKVYVYFPNDINGEIFQFKTCDFKGTSNKSLKQDS